MIYLCQSCGVQRNKVPGVAVAIRNAFVDELPHPQPGWCAASRYGLSDGNPGEALVSEQRAYGRLVG